MKTACEMCALHLSFHWLGNCQLDTRKFKIMNKLENFGKLSNSFIIYFMGQVMLI